MKKSVIQNVVMLGFLIVGTGCSGAMMDSVGSGVEQVDNETSTALKAIRSGQALSAGDSSHGVRYVETAWLPVSKVDGAAGVSKTSGSLGRMIVVNRAFADINDVVSFVSALTSLSVTTGLPATSTAVTSSVPFDPIVYSGPVSGFLDLVASRYNLSWEWHNNSIMFFKTKSQTFRLAALPGDTSLSSEVGTRTSGGSSGGGTSSSSTSSTDSEMNSGVEFSGMSVWKGIEDSIKTMLSTDGKLTVTPATGTITVEDTPVVLGRVERFIDEQNLALSRQVVINVRVLTVDLSGSNEYGIDWNAVYESAGSSFNASLVNDFSSTTGSSNLTLGLIAGSPWDESSAIMNALSKQGKVSQVTSASIVTINNQPAPIQVGRKKSYLASSTTTLSDGGSSSVSLTPGQLTTGFSMNVLPHILDSKKLMLQYSGDISSLIDLVSVTSGGSSIQTPEIDTRNFLQRVVMNSGETLVVSGFEQFNLSGNTQGVGRPDNVALGGGVKTSQAKSVVVVLIQPVLNGTN